MRTRSVPVRVHASSQLQKDGLPSCPLSNLAQNNPHETWDIIRYQIHLLLFLFLLPSVFDPFCGDDFAVRSASIVCIKTGTRMIEAMARLVLISRCLLTAHHETDHSYFRDRTNFSRPGRNVYCATCF